MWTRPLRCANLTSRRPIGHPCIAYPRGCVGAQKILIAYGKAVPVQFEGLKENGLRGREELSSRWPLTCPSCGNDRNFLVKTLQMHVVQLRDDSRVEANEEGRPAVIEVLCDECEKELNFADFDEDVRNEVLLTLGAR